MTEPISEFFGHGWMYPDTNGVPRSEQCPTCAFAAGNGTVRESYRLDDLIAEVADYEDFVCHTPEDGSTRRCTAWHNMFGKGAK